MEAPWTADEATHLLRRATFFAGAAEVEASLKLGKKETVRRLVAGVPIVDQVQAELLALPDVKADGKNLDTEKIGDQQSYWLYRMIQTQAPLIEKMTLFWHGHFATSLQKVREVRLMVVQNELFRKFALGSFYDLVLEVGKDPAMMLYLDANSNRKGKPNENYAREVMELFTLGIGNYTEEDIKDAARSLTGWNVNKETGEVKFQAKQHDTSTKTVLHETGNFNETDLVNILFKQKAMPLFMARKLLQFFCTPEPSQDWIQQIADDFSGLKTVGEVLQRIFLSDRFYAPEHRLSVIRTPAEYVAGFVKAFELPLTKGYVAVMRKMGQELYLPPDVAGWRGGTAWLMTSNLLARYQFAQSVSTSVKQSVLDSSAYQLNSSDSNEWIALWEKSTGLSPLSKQTAAALAKYAEQSFIHTAQKNQGKRGLLYLLMASPEAQMK